MRTLPPLATKDRVFGAVLVVSCGIAKAGALAVAAFATRAAFGALHAGTPLPLETVLELALAGVAAAVCFFLSRRQAEALGQSYAVSLRRTLYEAIASLPKSRHDERRLGALSLRFVGDLSAARLWFGRGLPNVLSALVILPGAALILFSLDTMLATLGLIPLIVSLIVMVAVAWQLEKRHRKLRARRANIAIAMIERIAVAPELDLMGRTDKELRALDTKGQDLAEKAVVRRGRTVGLQAVLQVGLAISGLMMLWAAGQFATEPATVAACLSVLALLALPLQDLGAAWDQYCAWRVAREKAMRLLKEPAIKRRRAKPSEEPVGVSIIGQIDGESVSIAANPASATALTGTWADTAARMIAGLDAPQDVELTFNGRRDRPNVAFIGDNHVGLQGSLRRSATLSSSRRPKDAIVVKTLKKFGLSDLLDHPLGLDQRLAEHGKGLSVSQTLRLDLARAILSKADVIVISSARWQADRAQEPLLASILKASGATVILTEPGCQADPAKRRKVH